MISKIARFAANELRFRKTYSKFKNYTMASGPSYVGNLHLAARVRDVPGSVIECGTWRGGMIAGIADVLGSGRKYFLFDSYEGLPRAEEVDGPKALAWQSDQTSRGYHNNCAASEEEARRAMAMSAAKEYRVTKGWFEDTLPKTEIASPIALLRLDGDWYSSTKCILDNFASRVAPGGVIIVDDYHTWEGCTQAVNEYAAKFKWRINQSCPSGICFIVI
jgi:O-methyltransferase